MNIPSADLQRLLAEEPFVRALAQSLVAGEADDIVQQAYLRAIEARPAAVREPRSWLARIVRNLAADERRRQRRAAAREAGEAALQHVPSSAELAASEELRRRLVAAVDALPEHLRTAVLLRYFEGLPPRRIAKALAVPVSVVWSRLHAGLVALRARLDAEHGGDRRAWLLPLVPFAASPRGLPWVDVAGPAAPALALGVITMTTKTKLAAFAAVLLAAVLLWTALPDAASPRALANRTARVEPAVATLADAAAKDEAPLALRREAANADEVATTGELVVTVRYASEPTVAAGHTVLVRRRGGDLRVGVLRAVTDGNGVARFTGLAPGELRVRAVGSWEVAAATIAAGRSSPCEIALRGGMTLTGVVVDTAGAPVAGALVETAVSAMQGIDADIVAVTGADGTFTVRECYPRCLVGARAAGYAASPLLILDEDQGGTKSVRIELSAVGGAVEGVVVDAQGAPVSEAVVRVGEGRTERIQSTPLGTPPLPAQVGTDASGRFTAIGLPVGRQPLVVRAEGYAPWIGACEIVAHARTAARVSMQPGVTCRGRVSSGGQPVDRAKVGYDGSSDFLCIATYSGVDGTYELRALPSGDFELQAEKDRVGRASARVRGGPGASVCCDFELSNGLALRGRSFDAAGAPVQSSEIRCRAEGAGETWSVFAMTDADGRFLVAQCPPGRTLSIEATLPDHLPWQRGGIDPNAGELEIRFAKETGLRARITGRLLRPDGSGATGTTIYGWRQSPRASVDVTVERPDGAFVLEVPAGTWSMHILVHGHPEIRRGGIELQAGAVHDVGVLQLVRGGTLVLRDDEAAKFVCDVFDAHEHYVSYLFPARPRHSDLLAPGDYLLFAHAEGSAAQVLPFSITADRETVLTLKAVPGIRRRVEFVPAPGADVHAVSYQVRRAGALVMGNYVVAATADGLAQDVCLVPGDYELTTSGPLPKVSMVSVRFTVADGASEPVRVMLR
jgi:RNA polymerase sigma-70 factor (ECF subfamily)